MIPIRLIILIPCLWLMVHISHAQEKRRQDVVMLEDGSRYKGTILEYQKGTQLILLLTSQDTLTLGQASVGNITGITVGKKYYNRREGGYWAHVETGLNFGENNFGVLVDGGNVQASGGYQWGRLKRIGIGVAREGFTDIKTIPVFLTMKGDWFDNKVTPYHFLQIGHSFGRESDPEFQRFIDVNGGFRLHTGIGLKIHGQHTHFTLGLGYLMQEASFERTMWSWPNPNGTATDYRSFRRFAVRLGIGF